MSVSQGRVIFSGRAGGMLVVQHEDGFTLVEMLGCEGDVQLGDTVVGDWNALGDALLFKGPKRFATYFQGTWGSHDTPVQMARGR